MSRGAGTSQDDASVLSPLGGSAKVPKDAGGGYRERRALPDRRMLPPRVLTLASQRRRRGGPMTREALVEFARFLMTRPVGDRVAQYLVTRLMSVHHALAATIGRFGPDGALTILGSYGMPDESLDSYATLSLWDSSPMSDAVISGEPVILLTTAEVDEEYPDFGDDALAIAAPMAVWPLALPHDSHGTLHLALPSSSAAQALLADGAEVAVLLSLYLSLANQPAPRASRIELRPDESDTVDRTTPSGTRSTEELTERQSAILARMATGQTNAQIARDIGFSESTVRQETMAIYRYLGATGRHDATRLATERGLIGGA